MSGSPIQSRRTKRNTGPFSVIVNTSFPCEEIPQGLENLRFNPLTDDDKLSILVGNGGSFLNGYMAVDLEQAEENFKNLLITTGPIKDMKTKKTKLFDVKTVNYATKKEITQAIRNEPDQEIKEKSAFKSTTEESCAESGSAADFDSQYLITCTKCSKVTVKSEDYWPRIFNEVSCHAQDNECFIDPLTEAPHGKCVPSKLTIELLEKRPGMCSVALQNGESVIVEQWDIIAGQISVGCECYINIHSVLKQFLT